jgi:hypothetical protein
LLARLEPLAIRIEQSIPTNVVSTTQNDIIPWQCMALALMNYRDGHYSESAGWSTLGLKIAGGGANLSQVASTHAILAMADHQLGRSDEARTELAKSHQEIEDRFKAPFTYFDDEFDWLLARLLEREATGRVENAP